MRIINDYLQIRYLVFNKIVIVVQYIIQLYMSLNHKHITYNYLGFLKKSLSLCKQFDTHLE